MFVPPILKQRYCIYKQFKLQYINSIHLVYPCATAIDIYMTSVIKPCISSFHYVNVLLGYLSVVQWSD